MGLSQASTGQPSRPKFSWDIKSAPWTDGEGDQTEYKNQVELWKQFHDKLKDNNSHKIPENLQGIVLKSQLFGRAKDLCCNISDSDIAGDDGAAKIVNKIHQRDSLSVVSKAYKIFNTLCNNKRGRGEP